MADATLLIVDDEPVNLAMQGLQPSLAPRRDPEPLPEADDTDAVETFRPHRAAFVAHDGRAGARRARELEGSDFAAARQTLQALLRGRA